MDTVVVVVLIICKNNAMKKQISNAFRMRLLFIRKYGMAKLTNKYVILS